MHCTDCGRKITSGARWGRCLPCHNERIRKGFPPQIVPIYEPTDKEMIEIQDGLILQRREAMRSENICLTDDPAEEIAIRRRIGL
jgi:hypothetical protein